MTKDEVYEKVQGILVEALGVDAEEVVPSATLSGDLGAESIDYLDISFRLEKTFKIQIPRGELFPENLLADPQFVQDGRVTPFGLAELKKRMPFSDFTAFEKEPTLDKMPSLFTVNAIVKYVETKVGEAH